MFHSPLLPLIMGSLTPLHRLGVLVFGVVCFFAGLVTVSCYFLFELGRFEIQGLASLNAVPSSSSWTDVLIDIGLVLLFTVPHSILARESSKKALGNRIPRHLYRSAYVLMSAFCLLMQMVFWRPLCVWSVWDLRAVYAATPILAGLFLCGVFLVLGSCISIDLADLFGLRQTYLFYMEKPYTPPLFQVNMFFSFCRNPTMTGFLLTLWSTPYMTVGHLLLAMSLTIYVIVGVHFEEKQHAKDLGAPYLEYKKRTPMFFPYL